MPFLIYEPKIILFLRSIRKRTRILITCLLLIIILMLWWLLYSLYLKPKINDSKKILNQAKTEYDTNIQAIKHLHDIESKMENFKKIHLNQNKEKFLTSIKKQLRECKVNYKKLIPFNAQEKVNKNLISLQLEGKFKKVKKFLNTIPSIPIKVNTIQFALENPNLIFLNIELKVKRNTNETNI